MPYLSNRLYIEASTIEIHSNNTCSIWSSVPAAISSKTKRHGRVDSICSERCFLDVQSQVLPKWNTVLS